MSTPKILFTAGLDFGDEPPAQAMFVDAGFEVVCSRTSPGQPQEETREKLAGMDAVIAARLVVLLMEPKACARGC